MGEKDNSKLKILGHVLTGHMSYTYMYAGVCCMYSVQLQMDYKPSAKERRRPTIGCVGGGSEELTHKVLCTSSEFLMV